MIGIDWSGHIGPTRSNVKLYRSRINKETFRVVPGQPPFGHYPEELTNDVLDAQTTFLVRDHLITMGGEWRKENLKSTTLTIGEDDATHTALFVQDEIELFDRLRLTLGGRWDHHDAFGSEFSPRIYALYQLTDTINLKAGYGQAFNAPTIKQVSPGYYAAFGPHTFLGNPDVKPETAENYELGVEYFTSKFRAKAYYFHNSIEDMIAWELLSRVDRRSTFRAMNIDEARTRGIEMTVGVSLPAGFDISANYTYLDARDKAEDVRLAGRPRHTISSKLVHSWEAAGLTSALRVQFIGDQVMRERVGRITVLTDVPDYTLVHFSTRKKITNNFEIQVGVENIGDLRLGDKTDLFGYEERGRFFFTNLRATF